MMAGVSEAARVFAARNLKGSAANLNVGWLMKMRLGKGLSLPVIGAHMEKWNVQSWSDSSRTLSDGIKTGYEPATYFGWNPISIAGALYYMTGQERVSLTRSSNSRYLTYRNCRKPTQPVKHLPTLQTLL